MHSTTTISNNSDNIYKLYKLVFKNVFLSKYIFKLVRGINKQITDCNSNYKNKEITFTQRCRYNEATFEWMINNNHFELIKDKLKYINSNNNNNNNNQEFTYNNLLKFLKNNNNEIINNFYKLFKSQLFELSFNLFELSIDSNNLNFLNLIYNDYYKISNNKFSNKNQFYQIIYEKSILSNNLEIIDFINSKFKINLIKGFNFIITNENLNQILLNIEHYQLFKKLKFNTSNNFSNNFQSLLNATKFLIRKNLKFIINCTNKEKEEQEKEYEKSINYFKNLIYLLSSNFKNPIIDKISKRLESSNKNKNGDLEFKRILLLEFIKLIKSNTLSNDEWIILVLKLSREIGDFNLIENENLLPQSTSIDNNNNHNVHVNLKLIASLIINLSIKYCDSNFIQVINKNIFKDNLPNNLDELYVRHHSTQQQQQVSSASSSTIDDQYEYFNTNLYKLENQIQLIETCFKYNLKNINQLLKYIFENYNNLTIENSLEFIEIVKKYSGSGSQFISGYIFSGNFELFKYYYYNNEIKQLFNWNDIEISKMVISNGNLEFIKFIIDNNLGGLDYQYSINYSKNRNVAEFLYEKYHFKFNDKSLSFYSELNEYDSNYLFYYSFNKLISDNMYKNSSSDNTLTSNNNNNLYIINKNNYKQIKYLRDSGLNENELKLIGININGSPTLYFEDALKTGNLKFIYNFIKENQDKIILNSHFYNNLLNLKYMDEKKIKIIQNYINLKLNKK